MNNSFLCTRCNYKFSFDFNKKKNTSFRCPYCGKDDKIVGKRPAGV